MLLNLFKYLFCLYLCYHFIYWLLQFFSGKYSICKKNQTYSHSQSCVTAISLRSKAIAAGSSGSVGNSPHRLSVILTTSTVSDVLLAVSTFMLKRIVITSLCSDRSGQRPPSIHYPSAFHKRMRFVQRLLITAILSTIAHHPEHRRPPDPDH